eukprot:gene8816-13662_t
MSPFEPTELGPAQQNDVHLYSVWKGFLLDEDPEPTTSDSTSTQQNSVVETLVKELREDALPTRQLPAWNAIRAMPDGSMRCLALLELHFDTENGLLQDPDVKIPAVCSQLEECLKEEGFDADVASAFECLKENCTADALWSLLKCTRPVNLPLVYTLLEAGKKAGDDFEGKDIVALLGETGCGKSTTMHWLAGAEFEEIPQDHGGSKHLKPKGSSLPAACTVGSTMRSETRCVCVVEQQGMLWCDTPGFSDTDLSSEIVNGTIVAAAFNRAKSVLPIGIVGVSDIGPKGVGLVTLIENLMQLIPQADRKHSEFEGPGRFKEWLSDKAQKELGSQFGKVTQQYSSDLLANRYIRAKYYYDLVVHFLDLLSEGAKELKDAFRNDFAKQSGTTAIEWFDEEWTSLQNIGERSASLVIDLIKKATPLEAIKLVPTTLLNRTAHDNMSAQAAEWFESQKEKTIDELENDKLKDACTINVSFKDIAALELSILEGEFAEQIVRASYLDNVKEVASMMEYASELQVAVLGTLLSAANALKSVDRFGPFGDDQSSFGHLLQIAGSNLSMLKHGLMAQLRFARQHQQFKAFSDAFARLSADGTEVSEEARMLGQEYGESLLGSLKEIAERVRSLSSVLDNPTTRTIQDCIQRLGNLAGIREITFVSEDTKIELKAAHIDSTKLLEDSIFAFTKAGVLNSTERFRQLDECEALAADMPENWLSFQEKLSEAIQEQWATIKRSYKAEAAEVGRRSAADFYSKPPMLFLSTLKELGPRDECYYAELHTEVCNGIVTGVTAEVQALKDDDEADFDWWQGLNKIIPEDLFIRISPEIDKARDEVENEVKNFVQDGMLSDALTEAASILDQWQRFAEAAAGNQLPLPLPHTADSLLTRAGDLWTLIESAVVNELKLFLEPFPLRLLQDKWMFLHGACVVEARVRNSGDARGVRVADSYCDAIKKVLEHLSMARFLRDCDSAPSIELCPFLDELRDLDNYVQALNKEKNEGKTFIQRLKELIPPSLLHGATDVVEYAKCVESLKENLAKTVTTANQELKGHPKLPSLTERTTLIKDVSGSLKKLKELTLERLKPHVGDVSVMFKESCGTVGKNLEQIHDAAVEIINGNPWASESRETWDNLNVYCSVLGLAHMHLDPEHHNLPQKARSFLDYVRRILNDTLDSCFADSTKITIETFVERLLYLKAMAVHTSEVQALLTRVICGLLQKQDPGRLASLRELLQSCQATNQQAYARQMIEEHKEFDNIAVRYRNVRTQVDAESLLKMMLKDTSNTKLDAKKLLELHRKFEKEYWVVLDEDLQLMREEKTKEDLVRRAKKIGEGVFSIDNTVTMVVCVFAYWTLSFEDSVQLLLGPKDPKRPDEYRGGITKPNAGQVLSIFRLLGLDGSDGKNFKNHFAEILTGQGKSIVTAAVAIIAALLGYSVDCICYSTYLHSDIRQLVVSLLNGEASSGTLGKQAGSKKRFAIIDEVDVLLQEDFYSEEYCVFAMLQREEVTALAAHLWRQHKKKKLTIEDLKTTLETVEGAACVGCLGPKWNPLMEAAVQHMVAALVNFSSHEGKYVVCKKRQKIGYRRADHKVDFEISYGYSTMWAYFKEHDNHAVTLESRNGKTGLNIDCGCFSYAQIPQQYDVVVGLTGTLKWLSETERAVLKEEYNVEGYTYVPSVYPTNHALVFAGDTAEGVMLNKPDEHYTCIVDAVKQCQDKVKRPVIVFFETRTLDDFLKSNVSKQLRGVQELREGRTNRQGNKGSFAMILNQQALEGIGIDENCVKKMKDENKRLTTINKSRSELYDLDCQKNREKARVLHEVHEEGMRFLHTLIKTPDSAD